MGSKLGIITREEIFEQLSEIAAHYSVVVKKVNMISGVIRKQRDSKTENTIMLSMDVLRPWIFYQFCLTTLKACARAEKWWDKDMKAMELLLWEVTTNMRTLKCTKKKENWYW